MGAFSGSPGSLLYSMSSIDDDNWIISGTSHYFLLYLEAPFMAFSLLMFIMENKEPSTITVCTATPHIPVSKATNF